MVPLEIEHHAVMFALLAQHTIEACGEDGERAIRQGVARYGRERGARMAARARAHGETCTPLSYQAYGEWRARPGQQEVEVAQKLPSYTIRVKRCPWCDAWKKYGLEAYGRYYCEQVDDNLAQGYLEGFHLIPPTLLSRGDDCCTFDMGFAMDAQAEQYLARQDALLGDSCRRDFAYHTAHLYDTMRKVIARQLGKPGVRAVQRAVKAYCDLFGKPYFEALEGLYPDAQA
nr:L-2-amino-thiazoline-4-carboxylic acid hydrolase [Maliibacterium massiliense]